MPGGIVIVNAARHRMQKGNLFLRHGSWNVKYYAEVPTKNGSEERVWRQTSSVLGRRKDYPNKVDILPIFDGFMDVINDRYVRLHGPDPPFATFVEEVYLRSPHVMALSPSTRGEYNALWKRYLQKPMRDETLRSVRPFTIADLLESIVSEHDISKNSIARAKSFLSGVYTFARNHGYFDQANPVVGVKLPKAREGDETYAYCLNEELAMMAVLELREKAAVAVASFAGLSKSEMQGLRWEDRADGDLRIRQSVWSGIAKETKTRYRKAPVPVIAPLAEILDGYWDSLGRPAEGWMWTNQRGELPIAFQNLQQRNMAERLEKAGLEWHGWHAFRRGLASNLSELGVPDNVIQKILRHGDIGTTQKSYRKTRPAAVTKAMKKLSKKVGKATESRSYKGQTRDRQS